MKDEFALFRRFLRRSVLVIFLLMMLFVTPKNLIPYDASLAIPTEQNVLSELQIGDKFLTERGYQTYLGGGSWSYFTKLGITNTWNGEEWVRWIYNATAKSVKIGNVTLTHLEGGTLKLVADSGLTIGRLRWYSQYYAGGQWQNVSLPNYQFLGFEVNETHGVANQRFWGSTGELVVSYIYRNNEEFKVTVNVTNNAAQSVPVRIFWVAHDLKDVAENYELIVQEVFGENMTVGIDISGFRLRWLDALTADPNIAVNTVLDKANRRAAVVFGNQSSILPAGHTYTLDPSVNPVTGADGDDDWWHLDETGPTWSHKTTYTEMWIREYLNTYWYVGQVRFSLAIPSGATITSANLTLYESVDQGDHDCDIWRMDEADVGDLEADAVIPACDWTESATWDFDGVTEEYNTDSVTSLVQNQIDLGGWASGQYIGFHFNFTDVGPGSLFRLQDYQHGSNFGYMNVTYTVGGGNNVPSNDGCVLTNPDDTDNLYATYREYIFTSNSSDADGFADIDYIELSLYSGSAYWTVRYDEDTDTFSEELGASYIILGGSSSANEDTNDIDVTWYIEIEWTHGSIDDYDLQLYTVDDEPESDTDLYDLNYDVIAEVDITTGPTLDDGSGTADRGDYNTVSGISVSGTIDYYSSSISPASDEVDVFVICSDVAGSPWSDTSLVDGAFSLSVDSDDEIGLDTYSFKVVEEAAGSGGNDLCHSSESNSYIADRILFTIVADSDTVVNGTQVNFTVTAIYDYDDSPFSWWNISVTVDGSPFGAFNYASTNFNDSDESTTNVYSIDAFNNETVHIITEFYVNTETVIWYPEGSPPTTNTTGESENIFYWLFYELFLNTEPWGLLGPLGLVFIGFFATKKNKNLGVFVFIVLIMFAWYYLNRVGETPDYWWHILMLLLGGAFTCIIPQLDD